MTTPKGGKAPTEIHVNDRHGDGWPRPPGLHKAWTGWMSHREYNIVEFCFRYGVNNIYSVGKHIGVKNTSAERIYHYLREAGIVTGPVESFTVTPMGKICFDMTDQYILQLDLGDEEESA